MKTLIKTKHKYTSGKKVITESEQDEEHFNLVSSSRLHNNRKCVIHNAVLNTLCNWNEKQI